MGNNLIEKIYDVLNISGGATKIAGLLGKSEKIIKIFGYKPHIITGVSAGALLSLPIALNKWDKLKELVLNMEPNMIFNVKPVNDKGKMRINSGLRAITGKPSFGEQRNLKKIIKEMVSCKEFNDWKEDPNSILIYIGVTNFNTSKFELINLKNCTYNEYVNYTYASTSIPLFVEPVPIIRNGKVQMLYDGGVRHHTCFNKLTKVLGPQIKRNITIYSRPDEVDMQNDNFDAIDMLQVLERTTDITTINTSEYDEDYEKIYCQLHNIKLKQYFCPKVLNSIYDMDKGRINELYLRSFNEEEYDKTFYTYYNNSGPKITLT